MAHLRRRPPTKLNTARYHEHHLPVPPSNREPDYLQLQAMASEASLQELPPNSFHDRSPLVIGVAVMCMIISTVVVGARIWTRRMILKQLGIDDYLSVVTLLVVYGDAITVATMTKFGLGKHVWVVEERDILLYMRAFYVSIVLYTSSLLFVKLTFLVQYYRVFSIQKMRKVFLVAMFMVAGWGLSQVFVTTFICSPIRGFWDHSIQAKCVPNHTQWYANAAGNIITDVAVFVLPLPVIRSLKLPRVQKMVLLAIFSLGFFTVAISVIRIRFLKQFEDFTWENVESSCWSVAEITSALVCACLPTLRPLLAQAFPSLASQFTRSRSSYMRYGSSSFGGAKKDVEAGFPSGRRTGTDASTESQDGLQTYELNAHEDSGSQSEGVVGLKSTRDEIALEQAAPFEATVRTQILPTRPLPSIASNRLERLDPRREIKVQRDVYQTKSYR